jgi:hypothetical protein
VSEGTEASNVVIPNEGVTQAERRLAKLCKKSFLSLWSYPAVYRDQGRGDRKGDGKEVCDLLVIFENHILIFSDKDCEFKDSGRLELDWSRWFKRAILKSADQVFGAERWVKRFPNNLFLDRKCETPLPVVLPNIETALFHRIVVAHDGARKIKTMLGGSGSLMVDSTLAADAHLARPFMIGNVDPEGGFVHVFDDTTLDIVMKTLDTITDFTAYLTKKERLIVSGTPVVAAGEEELLALYLKRRNRNGEHDFMLPGNYDLVHLDDGFWDRFQNSPERRAQIERNRVSYFWDKLIEKFLHHAMTGTQYLSSNHSLRDQEVMYRLMAREPRTRRRILADSFGEVLRRSTTSGSLWDARVMVGTTPKEPYYVFLFLRRPPDTSDEDYRQRRVGLLRDYCHVAKMKNPDAIDIIGIATESGDGVRRSEDLYYLNASRWDAEAEADAQAAQERLGILKRARLVRGREHEYPVDHTGKPRKDSLPSRNSKCECRSGKRFRYCCGRKYFPAKH